ncbi:unnamed protein product [Paramecium sonneborni]|uniref:Uncharacterized protein n=1 Tax=Paramecium sonneborni TaxID=65129 RepID=A0A8S1MYW4_9CILI|nr:unnamed protein product [Paramecium sonneborni]
MNNYQSLQIILPILIVPILLINQYKPLQQQKMKYSHLKSKILILMKTLISQNYKILIKTIFLERVLNLLMKLDIVPEVPQVKRN